MLKLEEIGDLSVIVRTARTARTGSSPLDGNLDSSLLKRHVAHGVQFLGNLAYLSLFSMFHFHKNGFLTVSLPLRPILMRFQYTVAGSAEEPDTALKCGVRSLLEFFSIS